MDTRLTLRQRILTLWRGIRELSGDDGYERYVTNFSLTHHNSAPLTRRCWFAQEQQRKWAGIRRCC